MTLLYYSSSLLDHVTGGAHPESGNRIRRIPLRLEQAGLTGQCRRPDFGPATRQQLLRVHTSRYLDELCSFAEAGGGYIEPDTALSRASYDVALLAAGSACDAVGRVVRGEDRQALCIVRPPGHHALQSQAMGFCLINNIAVAARLAIDALGIERVLIVDWDVHHGNGTQAAFWEDPQVGFFSMHRFPFYPGSGTADETGAGRGLGATLNLPIRYGTPRKDILEAFTTNLEKFAAKIKPELVLISAGYDAHRLDPIGDLGLDTEDFVTMSNFVLDVADMHADGKVVSVLEGGYHADVLADCIVGHLGSMLKRPAGQ